MAASVSNQKKNKKSVVRARIDEQSKERVEKILDRLGLNTSEAIRMYFKQIELHGGIPFSVDIPNQETRQAMDEAKEAESLESFDSKEKLFEDLDI